MSRHQDFEISELVKHFSTVPDFCEPEGFPVQKLSRLRTLHFEMQVSDAVWRCARRTEAADAELVRTLVEHYIDAFEAYQKLRWGRVRVKTCSAKILR